MFSIGFIIAPLVACILIVLINVYFGIHVIKREIIFIDIALASIAALGSAIGMMLFHIHHEDQRATWYTGPIYLLLHLFLWPQLHFQCSSIRRLQFLLKPLLVYAYAVATTLTVIILDKAAGGDVHVHDMLVGSILWVSW